MINTVTVSLEEYESLKKFAQKYQDIKFEKDIDIIKEERDKYKRLVDSYDESNYKLRKQLTFVRRRLFDLKSSLSLFNSREKIESKINEIENEIKEFV
jgi:predicted  nucleic acid-binding Zn-ribbon protein